MKTNWKKYLEISVAAFMTFAACTLFFFAVLKFKSILSVFGMVAGVLQSIIIGLAIAYLLNPVMVFCEKRMLRFFGDRGELGEKRKNVIRSAAILLALIFGIAIVVTVIGLMLPQLISSIYGIIQDMPVYINRATSWIMELARDYPEIEKYAAETVGALSSKLNEWFTTDVLMAISQYLGYITSGVISVVTTVMDIVVGLIVAVYVLYSKDTFSGQGKKIIYAIFDPDRGNLVLNTIRKSHQIFGGFIIGKIVDSVIIGVLAFVSLSLMNMPYTLLLSVIIGVTNIIPFFGPFIGAVPCVLIVLMVNPIQALYIAIFILILQQVDGNIIGPAILGESTGLSPFWVIFAIMLGGGLFGFFGMILGVPAFGVVYYLIKMALDHSLAKRSYPIDTEQYVHLKEVDEISHSLVMYEENEKENRPKALRFLEKRRQRKQQENKKQQ